MKLSEDCSFKTKRLSIESWKSLKSGELVEVVLNILKPKVVADLPWSGIDTKEKALEWIEAREKESDVFAITYNSEIIGFLILNLAEDEIKIGYLFSEASWGKGFGSELIEGLARWSKSNKVNKLSGGVSKNNKASVRVLEKNGFEIVKDEGDTLMMEIKL